MLPNTKQSGVFSSSNLLIKVVQYLYLEFGCAVSDLLVVFRVCTAMEGKPPTTPPSYVICVKQHYCVPCSGIQFLQFPPRYFVKNMSKGN